MLNYKFSKTLISIHIPKTGGTSFKDVLYTWFGKNLFFHYYNEREGIMPVKYELLPGICIHGHFNRKRNFGVQDYYPEATQFITILRDPFEILASRYFYVKKLEKSNSSFRDGEVLTIQDSACKYISKEIFNKNYHPNILDYMPFEITDNNYQEVIDKYFIYIGVMEDYQFSVNKLAEKLNFPVEKIAQENVSTRYDKIPIELREKFVENHMLEYKIYNYVLQNYRDR